MKPTRQQQESRLEQCAEQLIRELLDWEVRPALRTVPGVADVNVLGGFARSYEIRPRIEQMAALGIGIGAVTVMFAALWGVVLRPLPFPEPERLVQVEAVTDRGTLNSLSALDYFDYREGTEAFSSSAAQYVFQPGVVITGGEEPERATFTAPVSAPSAEP